MLVKQIKMTLEEIKTKIRNAMDDYMNSDVSVTHITYSGLLRTVERNLDQSDIDVLVMEFGSISLEDMAKNLSKEEIFNEYLKKCPWNKDLVERELITQDMVWDYLPRVRKISQQSFKILS